MILASLLLAVLVLPAGAQEPTPVTVRFEYRYYAVLEGEEVAVKVLLSEDPGREVIVPITVTRPDDAKAADYRVDGSSVTFISGQTEQSLTVKAKTDKEDDPGERLKLSFGSLPGGVSAANPSQAVLLIADVPSVPSAELASNMANNSQSDPLVVLADSSWGIRFTTGPADHDWRATKVQLRIAGWAEGATPTVALHKRGGALAPGDLIATLTTPPRATGKSGSRRRRAPSWNLRRHTRSC